MAPSDAGRAGASTSQRFRDLFRKKPDIDRNNIKIGEILREENAHLLRDIMKMILESQRSVAATTVAPLSSVPGCAELEDPSSTLHLYGVASTQTEPHVEAELGGGNVEIIASHPKEYRSVSTQTDDVAFAEKSVPILLPTRDSQRDHQMTAGESDIEHDYDGDDDGEDEEAGRQDERATSRSYKNIYVCKLGSFQEFLQKQGTNMQYHATSDSKTLSPIFINYSMDPTARDIGTTHQHPENNTTTTRASALASKPRVIRIRNGVQVAWRGRYIPIRLPPAPKPLSPPSLAPPPTRDLPVRLTNDPKVITPLASVVSQNSLGSVAAPVAVPNNPDLHKDSDEKQQGNLAPPSQLFESTEFNFGVSLQPKAPPSRDGTNLNGTGLTERESCSYVGDSAGLSQMHSGKPFVFGGGK